MGAGGAAGGEGGGGGGANGDVKNLLAGRRTGAEILAALNRPRTGGVAKKSSSSSKGAGGGASKVSWGVNLGSASRQSGSGGGGGDLKSAAREAIEAAGGVVRTLTDKPKGMAVMEKRNFAGKEMEVTKVYAEGSKEAKAAVKREANQQRGGLDSVLQQLEKTKKLNVLDKSKMDWKEVKDGDADMEEDLEKHKKVRLPSTGSDWSTLYN